MEDFKSSVLIIGHSRGELPVSAHPSNSETMAQLAWPAMRAVRAQILRG